MSTYIPPDLGDGWNLDCIDASDLAVLANHLATVQAYASVKAKAMTVRLAGHINEAARLERLCASHYARLPNNWKW